MITKWELDESDIIELIKEAYDTEYLPKPDDISVEIVHYSISEGYGMGEHEVPRVKIVVTQKR